MTSTSCKHLGFQFCVYEMQVLDSIYSEPLFFFFFLTLSLLLSSSGQICDSEDTDATQNQRCWISGSLL